MEWAGCKRLQLVRVDRRTAAGARRAAHAGHLRPHPQAHRRSPDDRALHGDAAAGAARRIPRGVPAHLAGESRYAADLDQPLHAAEGRAVGRTADGRRPRARHRRPAAPAAEVLEAADARRDARTCTRQPPQSPDDCIFAQTTECFSADLERRITPCQFGGDPDCANCGCMASAGLEAIGRHRLRRRHPGRHGSSTRRLRVGQTVARLRRQPSA